MFCSTSRFSCSAGTDTTKQTHNNCLSPADAPSDSALPPATHTGGATSITDTSPGMAADVATESADCPASTSLGSVAGQADAVGRPDQVMLTTCYCCSSSYRLQHPACMLVGVKVALILPLCLHTPHLFTQNLFAGLPSYHCWSWAVCLLTHC